MSQEEAGPVWDFVPLEQYTLPAVPTSERVRGGLGRLWNRLRKGGAAELAAEPPRARSESPPLPVLDEAAPAPSWRDAVQALDLTIGQWAEDRGQRDDNVRVVVGPSGAAADDVVRTWARFRQWHIVDPPGSEQILAGGEGWLAGMPRDNTPWVLAHLDQFYLRHPDGLELMERLIERMSSGQGRFLVGCGSWSWAYLTRVLKTDVALGQPLALQALDHRRLRDWIGEFASDRFDFCQQAEDGEVMVVGRSQERAEDAGGGQEDTGFLRNLAAFSRGIPLVAWAVWRDSLRLNSRASDGAAGKETTLWVHPWSELDFPEPPAVLGPCQLILLHETLLQGSTTTELLTELLPFPTAEVSHSLNLLEKARLIETEQGCWRVTRLGYPAVRECLHEAGYLSGGI